MAKQTRSLKKDKTDTKESKSKYNLRSITLEQREKNREKHIMAARKDSENKEFLTEQFKIIHARFAQLETFHQTGLEQIKEVKEEMRNKIISSIY